MECKILAFRDDPLLGTDDEDRQQRTAATYVVLPTEGICCKLFAGIGAGPLFPNWMTRNVYEGHTKAGAYPKRKCHKWTNPNPGNAALMKGDRWMTDDDGIPCAYIDVFKWWAKLLGWSHSFTFDKRTYSRDTQEPEEMFALPDVGMQCNTVCPNREDKRKPWCQESYPFEYGNSRDDEL